MQVNRVSTSDDDRQKSIHKVGDVVDVTISDALIVDLLDTGYYLKDAAGLSWVLPYRLAGTQVERGTPAWWPPRPGQLIRTVTADDDNTWWTYAATAVHGVNLVNEGGERVVNVDVLLRRVQERHGSVELLPDPIPDTPDADVDDADRCGSTHVGQPHGWVPPQYADPDGPVCGKPAFDVAHQAPTCPDCGSSTWATETEIVCRESCKLATRPILDSPGSDAPRGGEVR